MAEQGSDCGKRWIDDLRKNVEARIRIVDNAIGSRFSYSYIWGLNKS